MSIKYKLHLDPSPFGSSYYESLLSCPRRHRLKQEEAAQRTQHTVAGHFGVGTLFHAYMDLFYNQKLLNPDDVEDVVFTNEDATIDTEALQEAKRLARAYMHFYNLDPAHHGKTIGVEQDLPPSDEYADAVAEAVGVRPWTGRYDFAFKTTKRSADYLRAQFGLDVDGNQKFLGDWKTESAEYQNMREKFQNRTQFKAYLAAANAIAAQDGEEPFVGLIADVIIKTNVPKFRKILCLAPTPREIEALHRRYEKVGLYQTVLRDWANTSEENCFPRWGTCNYYVTSQCDRGATEGESLVPVAKVLELALEAAQKQQNAKKKKRV